LMRCCNFASTGIFPGVLPAPVALRDNF
jgi:hypothetical protein